MTSRRKTSSFVDVFFFCNFGHIISCKRSYTAPVVSGDISTHTESKTEDSFLIHLLSVFSGASFSPPLVGSWSLKLAPSYLLLLADIFKLMSHSFMSTRIFTFLSTAPQTLHGGGNKDRSPPAAAAAAPRPYLSMFTASFINLDDLHSTSHKATI